MDPDSEGVLRDCFTAKVKWNVGGYANPQVDELIEKIKTEMVTYARDAYLEEAWRIVTEDSSTCRSATASRCSPCARNLEIPPDPWDVPALPPGPVQRGSKSAPQ